MRARLALYLQLIRWSRPAGWLLLLWPTLSALWVAAGGWPGWHLLLVFVLGTVLMRSAGCCINDVADRDIDRHVKRTAQRPVTTGQVAPREALLVGAVLALLAFALVLTTGAAATAWSVVALLVTLVYPYAKRWVSLPQAVLGVAFGFGIPMAFAAVQGELALPWLAWAMLAGNLAWVLAYDTAYAMVDRDDDVHLGIHTSAITLGRYDVAFVAACYVVYLLSWTWLLDLLANRWSQSAVLLAVVQVVGLLALIRTRSRAACFRAFGLNHWLGMTLWLAVVASRHP
ncbi:MAG: 4-hydroxybenzoate octaprenyltransferase [Burkholderiaceae bacterium]